MIRESSFNMTSGGGGDEDIEGVARKTFRHPKGGLWKIRGAPKICIL